MQKAFQRKLTGYKLFKIAIKLVIKIFLAAVCRVTGRFSSIQTACI